MNAKTAPRAVLFLSLALLCAGPLRAQFNNEEWTSSTGTWAGGKDVVVAEAAADWRLLWIRAGGVPPAPAVDFGRYVVTGVFLDNAYILHRQARETILPAPSAAAAPAPKTGEQGWDFSLTFGPGRTMYMPTDIRVKTSDMNVVFKNVAIRERHSMEYYDFRTNPQPLRALDEPTNAFRLSAKNRKRRYSVYLQVFHPKFLVSAPGLNENVTAIGTVQGQAVHGPMDINTIFPKYQLTYGLVNISAGAEKELPIVSGKGGSLVYAPGVSGGVFIGSSDAVLRDPAEANTLKEFRAQHLKPIGASVSLTNRLTYAIPGERVNLSLTHTLTGGELEYGILDGTAHQNLSYQNLNVAVGVKLYSTKRRKKVL